MDSHDGRIHQSSHTRKPHDLPLPLLTTSPKVKGYILGSCLYHSRGTLLVYVKMQLFHYNCGKRFSSFLRFPQVVSFHCFEKPTVLHLIQLQSSDQSVPLSFHYFENLTVLHAIQSWSSVLHLIQLQSSDQSVPLSFHYFENLTVLHAIQSWSSDQNVPLSFHCLSCHSVTGWKLNGNGIFRSLVHNWMAWRTVGFSKQ